MYQMVFFLGEDNTAEYSLIRICCTVKCYCLFDASSLERDMARGFFTRMVSIGCKAIWWMRTEADRRTVLSVRERLEKYDRYGSNGILV